MSFADATLRMVLLGDDVSASAALRRVGANASATQKRLAVTSAELTRMGHTMSKAFTLPAIAVAGASVKMATDFNSAMTRIQTQAGGSAKDVRKLSQDVLDLGGKVQQGPVELANSLYHLKSVGLDNAKAMTALMQASHLAAVGNTSLEDTTNALAGAWRTGIRGATNFHDAVRTLNAVIGAGNMSMADLNAALGTGILPTAKTFGLTLKDVGSALAVFTDEGQSADAAATRLRMAFSLLGAPSQAADKVLSGIGLSGHMLGEELQKPQGLIRAIGLLKDHLEGLNNYYPNTAKAAQVVGELAAKVKPLLDKKDLTASQRNLVQQYNMAKDLHEVLAQGKLDAAEQAAVLSRAFGGGRTSSAILSLVNNFDVLQKKQKQVTDGMAKFGQDVAKQAQTPQAQFHTLISELETLGVELGDVLLPKVVEGAKDLQDFVTWFSKLPAPVKQATGDLALLFAAIGPGLIVAGSLAKAFLAVNSALKVLGITQAAATTATKANTTATTEAAAAQGQMSATMMKMRFGAAVAGMAALTASTKTSNGAIQGLLTVAGGAATGFAAGGPIGAAIGTAAGLFTVFAHHINDAADAAKSSKADFSGLAGSFDNLTGAVSASTRATIEHQLASTGSLTTLAKYGITTRTAVNAILGEGNARKSVAAALKSQTAAIADQRRQIALLTAANVAEGKAGTLTPQKNAERAKQIDAYNAQIKAEQGVIDTIRGAIPVYQKYHQQAIQNAIDTQDWAGKLRGFPKAAKVDIQANGVAPTLKAIASVAKAYHLTPKQITTVMEVTHTDFTIAQIQRVEKNMTDVNNVRPNLSNYKASLQAQMDQAGGIARSGGASVGYAMAGGLEAALAADRARIAAQSADLVSNAINAARRAAAAHSPSRKMIALGHDLVDGLLKGLSDRAQPLKAALSKIQQDVQNAAQRIKSDIQSRNQFAAGFQSFSTSAFGADFGTDVNGTPVAPTASSVLAFAQQQRAQARMVKADVRKLVKMGLSTALLRQLQSQGAAGIPTIEALAASNRSVIRQYDQLNAGTAADLRSAGMTAANRVYGSQIAQDRQDAAELRRVLKDLRHAVDHFGEHAEVRIQGRDLVILFKQYNHTTGKKSAGV